MTIGHDQPHTQRRSYPIAPAIILIIFLHIIFSAFGASPEWGKLSDADGYLRRYQVQELQETGNWYDSTYHRSNSPYGELRQWTRPLNVVLYAGAGLLTPAMGFPSALWLWGWIMAPLLQVAAVISLFWAVRPILSPQACSYVGLLFACQVGIFSYFQPGTPDHHGLLL